MITDILFALADIGKIGVLACPHRVWPVFASKMVAGQKLVILDVRPKEARMQDGIIPGAVPAHPEDIDPVVAT